MDYRDSLVRHLTATVRCSSCGASYQQDDVNILGHQDELWFLTVTCTSCHTQGLIAALVRDGAERPSTPTPPPAELATDDARLRPGTPVTEEDVADMREFLRGYRGDLAKLLQSG